MAIKYNIYQEIKDEEDLASSSKAGGKKDTASKQLMEIGNVIM